MKICLKYIIYLKIIVDLIDNGRNVLVTEDNKADYVQLVAQHRMVSAIKKQVNICGFTILLCFNFFQNCYLSFFIDRKFLDWIT